MNFSPKASRLPVTVAVALLAAASCGRAPSTPTAPAPVANMALAAAPVAKLVIQTEGSFPFGLAEHTPLVFDASSSTGAGLSYRISFGDGEESGQSVATHVGRKQGRFTARLTVTDIWGRSSSAEVEYAVVSIFTGPYQHWTHRYTATTKTVFFTVPRTLTGFSGRLFDYNYEPTMNVWSSAVLSGERDIAVRSENDAISLDGRFEWAPKDGCGPNQTVGPWCVQIRMHVRGSVGDGQTWVFLWTDNM